MIKNNDTTAIAAKLASETASKAADLATATANTAVVLASKTAESMAVISTDISWMKKSLSGIENTLKEIQGVYVTSVVFAESDKEINDHEIRIRKIEDNVGKWMGAIGVITFIVTITVTFLLKLIKI